MIIIPLNQYDQIKRKWRPISEYQYYDYEHHYNNHYYYIIIIILVLRISGLCLHQRAQYRNTVYTVYTPLRPEEKGKPRPPFANAI